MSVYAILILASMAFYIAWGCVFFGIADKYNMSKPVPYSDYPAVASLSTIRWIVFLLSLLFGPIIAIIIYSIRGYLAFNKMGIKR
jgi:hypothetical protein